MEIIKRLNGCPIVNVYVYFARLAIGKPFSVEPVKIFPSIRKVELIKVETTMKVGLFHL